MTGVRQFLIRAARPCDVVLLAAMHAESFAGSGAGQVWDQAALAEILAMPGAFGLLALVPGEAAGAEPDQPAGFLLGRSAAEDCEILSLGVARAWRRCGAARSLLHAALSVARRAGANRLLLEVAEDNLAAQDLYRAEGFDVIARRLDYYRRPDGTATALLLAQVID